MQLSDAPAKIVEAFAVNAAASGGYGGKNTIPVPSQQGVTPGAASFNDGFPPLTMTPLPGGVVMSGLDMNGILFQVSDPVVWYCAGAGFSYDSTFSSAIGGYPKGSRVLMAVGGGYWISTVDNNTSNPDTGGAGWMPCGNTTLNVNITPVTVDANVATAQNLMSWPVPAGLLNNLGRTLRISGNGILSMNGAQTVTFFLQVGSQTPAMAAFASSTGGNGVFSFEALATTTETGTDGAVLIGCNTLVYSATSFTGPTTGVYSAAGPSGNLADALSIVFQVGFSAASPSNSATQNFMMVEMLN